MTDFMLPDWYVGYQNRRKYMSINLRDYKGTIWLSKCITQDEDLQ